MKNEKIRILHITSALDGGGVDRLLLDYYMRLKDDVSFDFVLNSKETGILEKPLLEIGCKITHIFQFRENMLGCLHDINRILKSEKYDIVQVHSGYKAFVPLFIAEIRGVDVRIAHSHQADVPQNPRQHLMRWVTTALTKMVATDLFACGRDAAVWMWGERAYQCQKVYIMRNCIETENFRFSAADREHIRKELGLSGKLVFGCVARFSWQKNHEYLIDIFRCIHLKRPDAVLLLIGGGELEDQIRQKICAVNLQDAVQFLGVRDDVYSLLNALDCFLLPSRFEGLPVTLVEVQANGLPAYVSDTVTDEIKISDSLIYISLEKSPEEWAQIILQESFQRKENAVDFLINNGYDMEAEAKKLLQKYRRLCKK